MKTFWSGTRGERFALSARKLLQDVFPHCDFAISKELKAGSIFAQTQHKGLFIYRLESSEFEVEGPLGQVQHRVSTQEGTKQLLIALAPLIESAEDWLAKFVEHWPAYEDSLKPFREPRLTDLEPTFGEHLALKTFKLPLNECPDQGWLDRYTRALGLKAQLESLQKRYTPILSKSDRETLHGLASETDLYVRLLRKLIHNIEYKVTKGVVDFATPEPGYEPEAVGYMHDAGNGAINKIKDLTLKLMS